jgi:phage terminase large subunit
MLACYWVAIDEHGWAYVYDELYERGLIVSHAAAKIKRKTPPHAKIQATFAPPDLKGRQKDTGKSIWELFRENGIPLSEAKASRENGWADLHEWIKPTEEPTDDPENPIRTVAPLRILANCENLIRCMPMIQADEDNPNDAAVELHELTHGPDAIRYFVCGRPVPNRPPRGVKVRWTKDQYEDYRHASKEARKYLIEKWGSPW